MQSLFVQCCDLWLAHVPREISLPAPTSPLVEETERKRENHQEKTARRA